MIGRKTRPDDYYPDTTVVSAQGVDREHPQKLQISFPAHTAVAVEFGQVNTRATFVLAISTGESFSRILAPKLNFFGVIRDTPITHMHLHTLPAGDALYVAAVWLGTKK